VRSCSFPAAEALHQGPLRIEHKESGSRLLLAAFDDAKSSTESIWTTRVEVKQSAFVTMPSTTPAGIFVAGTEPGEGGEIAWSLVRPDGSVAYQRSIAVDDDHDAVLWQCDVTNTTAFLHFGHALAAVDVATGEIKWEDGVRAIANNSSSSDNSE
jgi:hypothetical protein